MRTKVLLHHFQSTKVIGVYLHKNFIYATLQNVSTTRTVIMESKLI